MWLDLTDILFIGMSLNPLEELEWDFKKTYFS